MRNTTAVSKIHGTDHRPAAVPRLCLVLLLATWAGAAGAEPASTDAEMEQFLLHAKIGDRRGLSVGITDSQRATLSLDGVSHDAHLQTVDVVRHGVRLRHGTLPETTFRDCYRYNVAAYRLDRLLDLRMVPVSVERRLRGRRAAVTWWVDDVAMMERDRVSQGLRSPDPLGWLAQKRRMRVFNQLIANTDLNQGNILITDDWQIRLVDFTRAFRTSRSLLNPGRLIGIDESLLARLRALTREQVEGRLGDCLTRGEIRALLARRDQMLEIFEGREGPVTIAYQAPDGR